MQFIRNLLVKMALSGNGYKTYVAGVASVVFGVSGLLSGQLDMTAAWGFIIAGLTTLGVGHKVQKLIDTFRELLDLAKREAE